MTAALDFDATPYVHAPVLDAGAALALVAALCAAMPKGAPAPVKKAADKLAHESEALQKAWTIWSAAATAADRRPADLAIDTAWGALEARLAAYASLPVAHHPQAKVAKELHATLFPDGTAFLKAPYATEWAESARRLQSIDDDGLGKSVDAIAGKEFLAEVRRTHAIYGEVLGITKKKAAPPTASLAEPLGAVRRAIQHYALKVAALAEDDAASIDLVRTSLAPIDRFRAEAQARRATPTSPTTTPDPATPAPTAPPATGKA